MTFNYTLSAVMTMGHKVASKIRGECNTYKEAISKGLKKAWAMAKGILPNLMVEEARVVHEDIQQEWAQSCLGALEVEVCEFEVARG